MKKLKIVIVLLIAFIIANCGSDPDPIGNTPSPGGSQNPNPNPNPNPNSWLIPSDEVFDGGPGKDGIPALESPNLVSASEATYLSDNDLVIGYKFGDETRAYPHLILDWHEIVNDNIGVHSFAITYCPLTGTAINWSREINNTVTTFGVSGLLYNTNLIPYDRATDSNWSQMRMDCVNGVLIGSQATVFSVVETTWKTWKAMFPDTKVMSLETGFNRRYGTYPYFTSQGDYRVEEYLIFPISNEDSRLSRKERVLGVINEGEVKAYRLKTFPEGVGLIEDLVGGEKIVVIGSDPDNFMVAFKFNDEVFSPDDSGTGIIQDQNGNVYNVFGEIISGPNTGERLTPVTSFMGFWFSWATFYPNLAIWWTNN